MLLPIAGQTASPVRASSAGTVVYSPYPGDMSPGAMYPRFIRLAHAGSQNGYLLATFEDYHSPSNPVYPIYRSTDGGVTWSLFSSIHDLQHHPVWGMRYQPDLFELPRALGPWAAGTVLAAGNVIPQDLSKSELELYASVDHGKTWSYVSTIARGGRAVPNWPAVWEPDLQIDAQGHLVVYYSDERHKAAGYNQLLGHEVSTNGGRTWGPEVYDVAIGDGQARPGMAVVSRMGNGKYLMSFELCGAQPDCGAHVKISADGDHWNPSSPGSQVQAADGRYLTNTPYSAWSPSGGPNGTIYMAAQMEHNADGSTAPGSGATLFANSKLGTGPWTAVAAPLAFATPHFGCAGWSQPLVPTGSKLMQMASTYIAGPNQCEIRFAIATPLGSERLSR